MKSYLKEQKALEGIISHHVKAAEDKIAKLLSQQQENKLEIDTLIQQHRVKIQQTENSCKQKLLESQQQIAELLNVKTAMQKIFE